MYNGKTVLALIPARGGSKSILRKNIKLLGNKPLIAYTIEEALKSKYIDRVIVSTDDGEIANIAKEYGAETPFLRPTKYAQDSSSSLSVILHSLKYLEKHDNYIPEIIVFLPPTTPFRTVKFIDKAIEKIENSDGVIGVCEVRQHPYFMMIKKKKDNLEPYLKIVKRSLQKQDVPELYYINSSIAVAKREYYDRVIQSDTVVPIFSGNVKAIFMDEVSSLDIDTEFDFLLAEMLNSRFNLKENHKKD